MTGRTAHPRSRGENLIGVAADLSAQGSSPLTRGKRDPVPRRLKGRRLIPAHAGKTPPSGLSRTAPTAHPRSRGENSMSSSTSASIAGSSPLTRGKPARRLRARPRGRLIPAHAGKTSSPGASSHPARDHPRSRGENLEDNWEVLDADGSSPLTRGKPGRPIASLETSGIIPAHAGKTSGRWGSRP